MPTYNPNDFYPSTNAKVESDGNVAYLENASGTLLASATRTSSPYSPTMTNYFFRGVKIYLNVTAASGTGGLQVYIQGQDPVSGQWYGINAGPTAVTTTGLKVYELYPGLGAATGNVTQATNAMLERTWNVFVFAQDATNYTYSVGYSYTF